MTRRASSRPTRRGKAPPAPPPETVFRAFVRTLERLDPIGRAPAAKTSSPPRGGTEPGDSA